MRIFGPMKKVTHIKHGRELPFPSIQSACEYAGLNAYTVRNYMWRNGTNTYTFPGGQIRVDT